MIEANVSFRVAVRHFIDSIKEAVEFNEISIEDIDWFIPHQANIRILGKLMERLGAKRGKGIHKRR
jgi:3-oxoacyl-[acyl-carrier-protein] synthase-3